MNRYADGSWLRSKPLRSTGRGIKRVGKKSLLRESVNRRNRVRFAVMGLLNVCEVQGPNCWNTDLTWAHGKKDRFLTMREREFLVIRACTVCHRELDEDLGHEGMLARVIEIIEAREARLAA